VQDLKYTPVKNSKDTFLYQFSACPDKLTDREQLKRLEAFIDSKKIKEPTHEVFLTTSKNKEDVFVNVKIIDSNVKPQEVRVDCNKMFSDLKTFIGKLCFGSKKKEPKKVGEPMPEDKPAEDTKEII
jgi:hypothetical protein